MCDYELLGEIGRGSFGKVFLGERKSDSTKVAVKMIECINSFHLYDVCKLEMTMMESLRHDHIVDVLDWYDMKTPTESNPDSYTGYIVFELMDNNLVISSTSLLWRQWMKV